MMGALAWQYVIVLALFLAIDVAWLSTLGRALYVAEIGPMMRASPHLGAALAFYLLYAVGILYFVVGPGLLREQLLPTILAGALLGLVAYGTFDLTSYAVFQGFTARMAVIDMAWGALVTAIVSGLSVWLIRFFNIN